MLFEDQELPAERKLRDPVLPAEASKAAKAKKASRKTPDGLAVYSLVEM